MPTLIEKLKEDVLKLKALCNSLKDVESSGLPNNNMQEKENEEAVNNWINEKKLLLVKTDLV